CTHIVFANTIDWEIRVFGRKTLSIKILVTIAGHSIQGMRSPSVCIVCGPLKDTVIEPAIILFGKSVYIVLPRNPMLCRSVIVAMLAVVFYADGCAGGQMLCEI